jgi:protein TonB
VVKTVRNAALRIADEKTNVVPFARRAPDRDIAPPAANDDDRPAPAIPNPASRSRLLLVLIGSLALHALALAAITYESRPLDSIGVVSISVDIVLGTDEEAGLQQKPSDSETTPPASADSQPAESVKPGQAASEVHSPMPPPEQQDQAAPPQPQEKVAVLPPERPAPKPKPQIPDSAKQQQHDGRKARARAALPSTPASSGIGRGRSEADSNYRGLVAAHLARHKQFPAGARLGGNQGTAMVAFSIDGNGRVTEVKLVRGSGFASLDQETQAMVRRASPFPPPPSGQPISFTVPVTFHLR